MKTKTTTPATPDDDFSRQLTCLNLLFVRDHYQDMAGQAAAAPWSHVDYLKRLTEGEVARRQDRSRLRRIQQARLPVRKMLEQGDGTGPAIT